MARIKRVIMSDYAVVRFVCALTDAAPVPVIEWLYTSVKSRAVAFKSAKARRRPFRQHSSRPPVRRYHEQGRGGLLKPGQ